MKTNYSTVVETNCADNVIGHTEYNIIRSRSTVQTLYRGTHYNTVVETNCTDIRRVTEYNILKSRSNCTDRCNEAHTSNVVETNCTDNMIGHTEYNILLSRSNCTGKYNIVRLRSSRTDIIEKDAL